MSTKNENSSHTSVGMEQQLKELWAQYVSCLDNSGLSESAKALRDKYFMLYRSYRRDKNWKNLITDI